MDVNVVVDILQIQNIKQAMFIGQTQPGWILCKKSFQISISPKICSRAKTLTVVLLVFYSSITAASTAREAGLIHQRYRSTEQQPTKQTHKTKKNKYRHKLLSTEQQPTKQTYKTKKYRSKLLSTEQTHKTKMNKYRSKLLFSIVGNEISVSKVTSLYDPSVIALSKCIYLSHCLCLVG